MDAQPRAAAAPSARRRLRPFPPRACSTKAGVSNVRSAGPDTADSCPTAMSNHGPTRSVPNACRWNATACCGSTSARETALLTSFPRTLHIAPEVCIMRHLKPRFKGHPGQYVTADLESPLADLHFDVRQIPLADDSVDVILCNHLLEHVADDRRALHELYRILKPGGWGILLSPVRNRTTNRPTRTTRSPIPKSGHASSDDTTTAASTARTTQTGCAKRASRPRTSTTPRPSPRPNAGFTPCRKTIFTSSTSIEANRACAPSESAQKRPVTRVPGRFTPYCPYQLSTEKTRFP